MKFKFTRKQILIGGAAGLALCLTIVAAVYAFRQQKSELTTPQPGSVTQEVDDRDIPESTADFNLPPPSPLASLANKKQINILILGYGGAGHQGGFLSDVVMVAHLNFDTKKLALIHIPRDLWVHIPVGNSVIDTKINAALALGTKTNNYPTADLPSDAVLRGSYLTKMALKKVTGLDIDFVLGVDFNSFSQAIDSIGGIKVNVQVAFEDPWYPVKGRELELCGHSPEEVTQMSATMSGFTLEKQFPCRYEHLKFGAGLQKMDGSTVLKFVRSRHSATYGGDFARGERQTATIVGIRDQLFSIKALDNIPKFFTRINRSVKTDLTAEAVVSLAPKLFGLPDFTVTQQGLSTANTLQSGTARSGAFILIPKAGDDNWSEVQAYIRGIIR